MIDLTDLIKWKAEAKLNKDVHDMRLSISKHFDVWGELPVDVGEQTFTMGKVVQGLEDALKKELPKYIERESKEFYDKVERLSQDVEDLLERVE